MEKNKLDNGRRTGRGHSYVARYRSTSHDRCRSLPHIKCIQGRRGIQKRLIAIQDVRPTDGIFALKGGATKNNPCIRLLEHASLCFNAKDWETSLTVQDTYSKGGREPRNECLDGMWQESCLLHDEGQVSEIEKFIQATERCCICPEGPHISNDFQMGKMLKMSCTEVDVKKGEDLFQVGR